MSESVRREILVVGAGIAGRNECFSTSALMALINTDRSCYFVQELERPVGYKTMLSVWEHLLI